MKFQCMSKNEILNGEQRVYEYEFKSEDNGPLKLGCFQGELFEVGKTYTFGIEFVSDIG